MKTTKGDDAVASAFEALGRKLFDKAAGLVADGDCDEWAEEIMELAVALGLAERESYDPEVHPAMGCEAGDTIWTWQHLPKGWRFVNPATGEDQTDLSERGVLVGVSENRTDETHRTDGKQSEPTENPKLRGVGKIIIGDVLDMSHLKDLAAALKKAITAQVNAPLRLPGEMAVTRSMVELLEDVESLIWQF